MPQGKSGLEWRTESILHAPWFEPGTAHAVASRYRLATTLSRPPPSEYQWLLPQVVHMAGREADHSPPFSDTVNNV